MGGGRERLRPAEWFTHQPLADFFVGAAGAQWCAVTCACLIVKCLVSHPQPLRCSPGLWVRASCRQPGCTVNCNTAVGAQVYRAKETLEQVYEEEGMKTPDDGPDPAMSPGAQDEQQQQQQQEGGQQQQVSSQEAKK